MRKHLKVSFFVFDFLYIVHMWFQLLTRWFVLRVVDFATFTPIFDDSHDKEHNSLSFYATFLTFTDN
jgi:hypothetical protein